MPAGFYHGKNRLIPATGINLPTLIGTLAWLAAGQLTPPQSVFLKPPEGLLCNRYAVCKLRGSVVEASGRDDPFPVALIRWNDHLLRCSISRVCH